MRPALLSALGLLGLLAAVSWAGCAGGQSGAEDFCGESPIDDGDTNDTRIAEVADDEDGGVEDDADAGPASLAAGSGPEMNSDAKQCILPDEGNEY